MARRLPAEWEPISGVLMAWPHADSDWRDHLDAAQDCVAAIAAAVTHSSQLLLISSDGQGSRAALRAAGAQFERVRIIEQVVGDTWCRDYGPLTVEEDGQPLLLDWGFNGWGLKYPAAHDNLATRRLHAAGVFADTPLCTQAAILEGGSIESDGAGTLLTTSSCLLEANRNPTMDRAAIHQLLSQRLGAQRVLWLDHGHLEGDDTDGHIDTLARLCPDDTICHISCDDPADPHFQPLAAMVDQLRSLRTASGHAYRLVPLPWPRPRRAADGHRLPATYANYLVCNEQVLVPTYDDANDEAALAAVASCFPGRRVCGIDCRVLVEQHGSLHCMTMQLPRGVVPDLSLEQP